MAALVPSYVSFRTQGEGTLTIESDREMPFEFTLTDGVGKDDGPMLMDCRISVKDGVGRFVTGSFENMKSYGRIVRSSRHVVLEVLDRHNEVIKHQSSSDRHPIELKTKAEPASPHGIRFLVSEP